MDIAAVDELLSTTRAVRRRLDLRRPVDREVILDCLTLAMQAPTASNEQNWRWMVITDADKAQMLAAIGAFGEQLPKAKAALFYYAGHGVQVDGYNYLLPVARTSGDQINRQDEVRLRAVDAGEVLVTMERARVPVSMVVLDACRNNPFKGAGRSGVKGLAQLSAPPGSLVVYATAPGRGAADGQGRNSPFSAAFVKELQVPGRDVFSMLQDVMVKVQTDTGGAQTPWQGLFLINWK